MTATVPDGRTMQDVDLVEDEDVAAAPSPAPTARGARRRVLVLLAVLVAVVAGAAGVAGRAAPASGGPPPLGAVVSLAVPLEERWRLRTANGWDVAADLLLTPARADGVLSVKAHDLRTGTLRWTVDVPPGTVSVQCPTTAEGPSGPVVVCQALGPLAASREAGYGVVQDPGRLLVLSAQDGSLVEEIVLGPTHVGVAAVGGDLVLARLVLGRGLPDTQVRVDRIDLAAGAPVWTVQEPLDVGRTRGGAQLTAQEQVIAVTGRAVLLLDGQDGTVLAGVPPDGRRGGPGATTRIQVLPHGIGVSDARERQRAATWLGLDGTTVRSLAGVLAEPAVNDGSRPEVVLTTSMSATTLFAVDVTAGEVLWVAGLDEGLPVVRAGGLVVGTGPDGVRATDLRTGAERWRSTADGARSVHPVTDGTFVLATGTLPDGAPAVAAVSLRDGSLLWRSRVPASLSDLQVADGQVIAVSGADVVGLG